MLRMITTTSLNHVVIPQVVTPPRYLFFEPRLLSYLASPARFVFQIIDTQRTLLSSQPRLQPIRSCSTIYDRFPSSRVQQTPKVRTHFSFVSLDPENILPVHVFVRFRATINQFDNVFNPKIEGCNGSSGPFEAEVNMRSIETDPTPIGNVDYPNTRMRDS